MKDSRFIEFEGSDGSGKQTQVALLAKHLVATGLRVKTIDFPQYENNFHGRILRAALQGQFGDFTNLSPHEASLLYVADRLESLAKIKGWLDVGEFVIADRFTSSNMIHQGGKIRNRKDFLAYLDFLKKLEVDFLGFPEPLVVVFLKVPVEVSLSLLVNKPEKDQAEKNVQYLKNSLACAEELAAMYGWVVIDCAPDGVMRSRISIHTEIVEKLNPIIFEHIFSV